ncbi:hypothetical protein NXY56_007385 [Leishmania guyanensis]|uniref:Uncharacterized protein n=1 Tax=Leishmania guyanensis TaxID=5670 RepID=A0A1E1J6E7_LEIGU|nr:hypothetical protein, unknown function [Leishmania guyanensis]
MCSNAAKKSFRPPFKHTVLCHSAASTHAVTRQLYRSQAFAPHAASSFADDSCAATLSSTPASHAPGTAAAVSEVFTTPKTAPEGDVNTLSRDVTTDPIPSAEAAIALVKCASSRRQLQQSIDSRQAELASTKVWSLVAGTLHWVTVSQAALQHLADAQTAGQVEQVLSELRIDPPSVLFSVEEGSFCHP